MTSVMPSIRPEIVVDAADRARLDRAFWRELWNFRDAFAVLVWRTVRVRYKQTVVGAAWVVLRPLLLMVVLTLIFGVLAGFRGNFGTPYPLVVLAGVIAWQFFSTTLTESANSLVANAQIIGRVYFPRVLLPASALASSLLDLAITMLLFLPVMLWYSFLPGWHLMLLPLALLLLVILTLGAGLWAAALNVRYRDFGILIPFALQVGFFASPVAYPLSVVPQSWHWLYQLNPVVGALEALRWCLLGGSFDAGWVSVGWSAAASSLLLFSGLRYFHRTERDFADIV